MDDVGRLVGKVDSYSKLIKQLKGSGLQAHHIIEKRFSNTLGLKASQMQCVALTKTEHQVFTNAWRNRIAYGTNYSELGVGKIWEVVQEIYSEYPKLLEAARSSLFH